MDDQLHLLTGAYALNALDDDERRRVEGLPFEHPTAQEARELSETAALLAAGTTPVAPPSGLKARLMAQIAVTPQAEVAPDAASEPPVEESPPVGVPVGGHPREMTVPTGSQPSRAQAGSPAGVGPGRFGERRRRPFSASSRWLAAAAAALLVAAGGAGVWGLRVQQQRDDALRALAAAQGSRAGVMDRILSSPDAKIQEVSAPGGAVMLIAHSKEAQLAGVVTIGMAAAPEGKAYELWLIDAAGAAKPAGLVVAGNGSTWNELPGGVDGAAYLGVTVEPAGGSPQPTTKPFVLQALA
ncbi:anti-sigma factor [Sinomonas sp. JGH33]|uniref:Regulator of SigK n=1 Tax=Sinomonas terricola TaxID=3110330 RepID=A0ABU5TE10_9MICC|nr:anti-sigma factor [Sinomonas sp. JGH33]MEA5457326.1 anti-sigma factor [Sinomonas sp. JGH33]